MKLVFACEQRFFKDSKDIYYTDSQSFGDVLWQRYLKKFDAIIVFARVRQGASLPEEELFAINNQKVTFIDVPYYEGPKEYLTQYNAIRKVAKMSAVPGRAYICRVPGVMGNVLSAALRKKRLPYAVEVVGDPWDVFAPGAINHPLAPFFRITGWYSLKKTVSKASAALYVTKEQLQKRYPVKKNCFNTNASDVILRKEYLSTPKKINSDLSCVHLLAVGSLAQMYKSPDIAIQAIAELKTRGITANLVWLGDGKYRGQMEHLALELGIVDQVDFKGNVSLEEVRSELSKTDIFLHISRTEGLPRAIVEAMGAGLPCIGSRVGGIPELLEDIALVDSIESKVVADKIELFMNRVDLHNQQAIRNVNEAKSYLEEELDERRKLFYEEIISVSVDSY